VIAKNIKLGVSAVILAGVVLLFFQQTKDLLPEAEVHETHAGLPARLQIISIGVDAAIEQVGILADGSMDVPKNPADTAWYQSGPRPGEVGSAVIDGHVDWYFGAKAVFTNLKNLKVGEHIVVMDEQGHPVSFIVRRTQIFGSTDDATNVFTSTDGLAHLNLITCQGVWDQIANSYTQRLVVFTDQE